MISKKPNARMAADATVSGTGVAPETSSGFALNPTATVVGALKSMEGGPCWSNRESAARDEASEKARTAMKRVDFTNMKRAWKWNAGTNIPEDQFSSNNSRLS
jgi:hypothetical protein